MSMRKKRTVDLHPETLQQRSAACTARNELAASLPAERQVRPRSQVRSSSGQYHRDNGQPGSSGWDSGPDDPATDDEGCMEDSDSWVHGPAARPSRSYSAKVEAGERMLQNAVPRMCSIRQLVGERQRQEKSDEEFEHLNTASSSA
jgi:hypothetical protein